MRFNDTRMFLQAIHRVLRTRAAPGWMVVLAACCPAAAVNAQDATTQLDLEPGFNLVSYPVSVPEAYRCSDMQAVLGASVLARFDAVTQRFETCSVPESDFAVEPGAGYLVEMGNSGSVSVSGPPGCPQVNLKAGVNLVGVPSPPAGLGCFELLQRFADVGVVRRSSASMRYAAVSSRVR